MKDIGRIMTGWMMRAKDCTSPYPFDLVKECIACDGCRRESCEETKELHCTVNPGAEVKKDKDQ